MVKKIDVAQSMRLLIKEVDRNTCQHDETHRAGVIWTVCSQCGKKWADDEGGFKPYVEPTWLSKARGILQELESDEL
jgi:ribosomal protein L37AE/L43A